MAQRYAVVDLETTGNQIQYDEIIQIGITFIEDQQIVDTYHTYVKTDLEIPSFIQALTNINELDLQDAPYFDEISKSLFVMLKDCVFVAHNVLFDLNFLKAHFEKYQIEFEPKLIIDTMELFKIAFPTEESYQLSELSQSLKVDLNQAHSADEDAKATALLFIKAIQKIKDLPIDTVKQLYYLSKSLKYDLKDILFEIVRTSQNTVKNSSKIKKYQNINYLKQTPIRKSKNSEIITIDEAYDRILKTFNFDYRKEQYQLVQQLFDSLMHNENALIEAPLGSGKSMSFVLASLLYYLETGEHILVSTHTKLLQNQLLEQEFNKVLNALDLDLKAMIIKSKDHYISLGLILNILQDDTDNYEATILKMQLLVWILETETGDIEELHLKGGQKVFFDQKRTTYVPFKNDIHYYQFIKESAQSVEIGITNHAHLLQHSTEDTVYQLFKHIIVDEAHRIQDYALNQVTDNLSYQHIKYHLGLLGKNEQEKLFRRLDKLENRRIIEQYPIDPIDIYQLKKDIELLHEQNENLFDELMDQINQKHKSQNDDEQQIHYIYDIDVTKLSEIFKLQIGTINQILSRFKSFTHAHVKAFKKELIYIYHQYTKIYNVIKSGQVPYVSIKKLTQKSTLSLFVKKEEVKDLLNQVFIEQFNSNIFISGTLTVNESFTSFKSMFPKNIEFNTYYLNDIYDLKNQAACFVPKNMPSYQFHNQDDYIETIVHYLSTFVSETNQKCLVLFTNYSMLYQAYRYMEELEIFDDYVLLMQQQHSHVYKIVQQFNQFDKTILLGTLSFFEGFDYQSSGIKCVMMTKLPFIHQDDPRYHLMKDEFENPFKDFVLPDAVTKFRQGIGRLIRNKNDQGLLVCFDRRILDSNYSKFFINALGEIPVIEGDINNFQDKLRKYPNR
ncbi:MULTISPECIES: helicase C-terminal domain-containing protein [Mammaliicoccus]|uniref:helicase C-terminal domain-containing protein n=1 Tax=Mammaliicoccus TaxID=2803850 RepID=UPI000D1C3961|nr:MULTISPECIES: helicase C-terminal domain-containing protein [Mammaliicoccus]MBW0763894.1 DEAD/DEAH box helicase family protein [Mammaliicoccus fleurettii]MEB6200572.1 DEAD/DEAH box helicase family protein [Mammaliicoccus fleurettii]MEB7806417.1 exonuclease domain-containing protein [Mammaliicoccus fleurettii]PTE33414.1 ATP-dependent helicase [Mammaliicoccus fleurettii]RIL48398.1 DEAD/DEAH box helicase [Mammaliicoccus fleurettii]